MADIAWVELDRHDRATGAVVMVALQEGDISRFEIWRPTVPTDPRIARGVQTVLYTQDGSQLFIMQSYAEVAGLVKIKRS